MNNPDRYSVDDVVMNYGLWSLFADPEGESDEEARRRRTRHERIGGLDDVGLLKPVSLPSSLSDFSKPGSLKKSEGKSNREHGRPIRHRRSRNAAPLAP